ncbi:hypothetical protein SAMN05421736_1195 [Evansella caseinilytica]|uniref:Uncharacterized protein n=1 Tax=Evansella caseinilytica TaxID=1503961 RepID=A0A1H3U6N6_9BACI|nr:hypothetical protein [Evansella caseinilytica]SDZ58018.1 hypothetical protein SAMN05421736_1195 [Evansella caseinilytica]
MKLIVLIVLGILMLGMMLFELSRLKANKKKEKWTMFGLYGIAFGLVFMQTYFPDTYGPTQLISDLFSPVTKLLK